MSEWLTGTQIENIRSYFDPENESADICEVANDILTDRKQLVKLVKRLERDRSIDGECRQCGSRALRCSDDCPYKQARACLKAQGE